MRGEGKTSKRKLAVSPNTCNFNYDFGQVRHLDQSRFVVKMKRPKDRLAVF